MWEQLATDQTDPWQVVPRQVFTPYDCLMISVAFVVLCRVGYLGVTGVFNFQPFGSLLSFMSNLHNSYIMVCPSVREDNT